MATHCSILAWKIPLTVESGGPQSKWSQRVGHNWATEHTSALHYPDLLTTVSSNRLTRGWTTGFSKNILNSERKFILSRDTSVCSFTSSQDISLEKAKSSQLLYIFYRWEKVSSRTVSNFLKFDSNPGLSNKKAYFFPPWIIAPSKQWHWANILGTDNICPFSSKFDFVMIIIIESTNT